MPIIKEDEYYEGIYQNLANILNQEQLSWIVHNVNEQIIMGKVTIPNPDEKKKAPRGKGPGTYSTSYTAKERVQLLIDAIRHTIVNKVFIEQEVLSFFLELDTNSKVQNMPPQSIIFSSEAEPGDSVTLDRQLALFRYPQAQKLAKILDRLQELLNNGY